jgi:hypothetical protein
MGGVSVHSSGRNTKAEPGFIKRRNRINGQWSPRLIEMLESPAYRVLSLSAHRVISRIEIELGSHAETITAHLANCLHPEPPRWAVFLWKTHVESPYRSH